MKKILTLIFCIFISFSSLCFGREKTKTQPTANDFPNIFRPIGDLFKKILGKEAKPTICYFGVVKELRLSQTEIIIGQIDQIQVQTIPDIPPNFDGVSYLRYEYKITGGKIIGEGANIIWDLSSVKVGTYTITASVDNGCSFCGIIKTKEVTVKECPDCK